MTHFRFGLIGKTAGSIACIGCLAGCGVGTQTGTPSESVTGQASISGGRLLRDGKAWQPHGYFQVAFEAGPNIQNVLPYESNATSGYSPQEYTDMVAAHADSVRVLIGQPSADPQNTAAYSATFVQQFISAVQAARHAGLTVIVGIQDETPSGETNMLYLPSAATLRVWQQLVPAFKSDRGILLELFNEPGPGPFQVPTATDWQNWQTAMNMTIAGIRAMGSVNVVVADGLAHAETLTGAPDLSDPLNQIAYAAHPYAFTDEDESPTFLDQSFGNFAATHPVIVTEYGLGYFCSDNDPQFVLTFFNYLNTKGVGIEIGAWDWGGTGSFGNTRYNFPASPTLSRFYDNGTYQGCTSSSITDGKRGPGLIVNQWYTTGVIPTNPL